MKLVFVTFSTFLPCYLFTDVEQEPAIRSPEHFKHFISSMKGVERIANRLIHDTIVRDGERSLRCGGPVKVPLGDFVVGFDPYYTEPELYRKSFIMARIRPEHLETGSSVSAITREWVREQSIRRSFDQPGYIVAKVLGGYGHKCNVIPQSGQLRNGPWKEKENLVVKFLEQGIERDSNGRWIKDVNGKVKPIETDTREVIARLGFLYDDDSSPKERPSHIFYAFMMKKNPRDPIPMILAGFFENRSYLKEHYYADGKGGTAWKDEPDFYNVALSSQEMIDFLRNLE